MKSRILFVSAIAAAALAAGCAHQSPKPPANASPTLACRDGTPFTEKGGCDGHGGIDRQASASKAQQFDQKQAQSTKAAGAPGEVWALPATKTYVCRSDADYGKEREGQYMSEAQAQAKGFKPAHGSCAH